MMYSLHNGNVGAGNAKPISHHELIIARHVNGEMAMVSHRTARAYCNAQMYYEDGSSLHLDR